MNYSDFTGRNRLGKRFHRLWIIWVTLLWNKLKELVYLFNDLNKHLPSINLETFACKLSSMEKGFKPFFCSGILRGSNTVITNRNKLTFFQASLINYECHRIKMECDIIFYRYSSALHRAQIDGIPPQKDYPFILYYWVTYWCTLRDHSLL